MKSFHGGLDFSHQYTRQPAKYEVFTPQTLYVPMRHGAGRAAQPCVSAGEHVLRGQLIGTPDERGVPVYSPVSGDVGGICIKTAAGGGEAVCVTISPDGTDDVMPQQSAVRLDAVPKQAISDALRACGICGMGGAGFPMFIKYSDPQNISHILINAIECEPGLLSDKRLVLNESRLIVNGARSLAKLCSAKVTVCVSDACRDAVRAIKNASGMSEVRVEVCRALFPQGSEKQLIKAVLGIEVPQGSLPTACGIAVTNAASAAALAQYVFYGMPATQRIITVCGANKPCELLVPVGTLFSDIIEYCGGGEGEIVSGGPMTGRICSGDVPVTLATTAVSVIKRREYAERACIRCGRCIAVCPVSLCPLLIERAALSGEKSRALALGANACIGCGCCSYICPARRGLTHRIREARA